MRLSKEVSTTGEILTVQKLSTEPHFRSPEAYVYSQLLSKQMRVCLFTLHLNKENLISVSCIYNIFVPVIQSILQVKNLVELQQINLNFVSLLNTVK